MSTAGLQNALPAPRTPCAGHPAAPASLQASTLAVPLVMPSPGWVIFVPINAHRVSPTPHTCATAKGSSTARAACRTGQDPPTSVILAQISVSRSPGLLSGVLSTCGRSSDLSVELAAMRKSLAWYSHTRVTAQGDSLQSEAFMARIRVERTWGVEDVSGRGTHLRRSGERGAGPAGQAEIGRAHV